MPVDTTASALDILAPFILPFLIMLNGAGALSLSITLLVIYFIGVPQSFEFDLDGTGYNVAAETIEIDSDLLKSSTGYTLGAGEEYNFTKELGNSFFLIPDEGIKYSLAIEYMGEDGEADIYTYPEDRDWASLGDVAKAGEHYAIVLNTSSGTSYPFTASLVADWEERVDIDNDFN